MARLPRIAKIVLPLLRAGMDDTVTVTTWGPNIDYRQFPMLNIRRVGGTELTEHSDLFAKPVIELTAYGTEGIPETEDLYADAVYVLRQAVRKRTQTPYGYLHSLKETMGATQFSSPFQDSFRIQGLIQLGQRPPRST